MPELATSFEPAQSNIEPSKEDWENAPAAHQAIADLLAKSDDLQAWGIDPILIGSYGRRVSIRRVYDVDMFCRLTEYPEGVTASEVLDAVEAILLTEYSADDIERYDRSVTVIVPDTDGLYVDVVPARAAGEVWEIPTASGEWLETNPVKMTELKVEKNDDFDEMYVPCVKLLRQARRTLLGDAKPGGFTVEMAFFTACEEGLVQPSSSMGELFTSGLEGVADVFDRIAHQSFQMPDPSMEGCFLDFDEEANFEAAHASFAKAATDARSALKMPDEEAGKAALVFQSILGGNDDHTNVFPMPAGFKSDGTRSIVVSNARPGDRSTTAGEARFG